MSLGNILKSIGQFVGKLLGWVKDAAAIGRDVANELKTIVDNPAWDVAVSLTSTKLDDIALASLRQFLASLVTDLGLADSQITDIGEVLKQASGTISVMSMPQAKAGTLNTISAAAACKYAELTGRDYPIETALTVAQPAYLHPELLEQK